MRYLFRTLAELYPDLGPHLEQGIAVAIDDVIYSNAWLEPLEPDSEVYILPQIGGGKSAAEPRMRSPVGSNSGSVTSVAGRRSPRISISKVLLSSMRSTGTNPSATLFLE